MIVDSSALIAIVFNERDATRYAAAIAGARTLRMAAANWLEAAIVVESRDGGALRQGFDDFVTEVGLDIVAFEHSHAAAARDAWRRFGKGRHPAKLNFGDCVAYGTAKAEGLPLLFKGDDFPLTDIEPALKD